MNIYILKKLGFQNVSFTIFIQASKAKNEKISCVEASLQRCSYKKYSENMQQIYRRTPMPKCNFNKVALQLY